MNSVPSGVVAERVETQNGVLVPGEKSNSQIVHDLRNVLTGLIGNVGLLRDHPDLPRELMDTLDSIELSAVKARNLSLQLGSESGSSYRPAEGSVPKTNGAAVASPSLPPPVPGSAGRILAMDDEPGIRALLSAALQHFGYKATTVADGADAVREYRRALEAQEPYSAVIMDLTVPGGMGGKETMQALKEIDPAVRGIVSSGYSTDPAIVDFQQFGFVARVDKPYRIQELGAILRQACEAKVN